jgi:hypothetical protein
MTQAAARPKRSWWMDKRHVLHCYSSSRDDCLVSSLVDLPEVSGFYDAELGRATKQINRLLDAVAKRKPPGMEPSLIVVEDRPFLAWTQPSRVGPDQDGAIGPDHDPDTIRQALRLKVEEVARGKKRSYILGTSGTVYCYPSQRGGCVIDKFWESLDAATGSFHDADMAEATLQVNAVLDRLKEARDPGRGLSFISVENALLLVLTEPGIGPDDEPPVIREALGLKDSPNQPPMWWAGEWWDGGAYSVGAVVSYRGGAYTCVNPVEAGPNDPPPADFKRWQPIIPASH